MKTIQLMAIFLLLIPTVTAIGLGVPEEREIMFEPFKEITLQYNTGNTGPEPLNVGVDVKAGVLQNYITGPSASYEIPAFSTLTFEVKITMPEELAGGFYPLSVAVSEKSKKMEGMGGVTGVIDTIYVISPFEEGHPYGIMDLSAYQQAGTPIVYNMLVKNIGKTPLEGVKGTMKLLLNGKEVKESLFSNEARVQPYATTRFRGQIDTTGLIPGYYDVETQLGQKTSTTAIALGNPTIKVFNVPTLKAGEPNTFNVTIKLENWANPIKDASLTFHVTNLMQVGKQVTLQPGENTVEFTDTANEGKGGAYGGDVKLKASKIRAEGTFSTDVIGKVTKKGLGFTKTDETTENETEAPQEQKPMLEQVKETAKNEIFLIVLLITSFAVFAFALGQYLARRKQQQY